MINFADKMQNCSLKVSFSAVKSEKNRKKSIKCVKK